MTRGGFGHGGRAWAALSLALAASALLCVAAFSSYARPALAGEAALARLAGDVEAGVRNEWRAVCERALASEGLSTWTLAEPLPAGAASAAESAPIPENIVADALLSETRRLERENDPAAALAIARDLLAKELDPLRRAEARLAVIRLAVRTGDEPLAREQAGVAASETDPALAREGISLLLLSALAAQPALPLLERAALRDRLSSAWTSGRLAVPLDLADHASIRLAEPAPDRAAWRRAVQNLLPEADPDPTLERDPLRVRATWLAGALGRVPEPTSDGPVYARNADLECLARRRDEHTAEGLVLAGGTLAARVEEAAREHGLLADGFELDFAGDRSAAGPLVRARTELAGPELGFALRHADPGRIVSAASERQALLRAGLVLLALLVAGAGLATFRAERRERRLAELKSAFVANVSHELRTPVSSLLLLSENLERGRVADEAARQRYFGLMRREALRLRGLIENVLDFSRLERGERPRLALEELDVGHFAQALRNEAVELAAAAHGELAFHAQGAPARIRADGDALRRATLNLVDNALKHSGAKEVLVSLGTNPAGALAIRVRDRGRGIPENLREEIFVPFVRLERGAAGAPGAGLGLAIVREIAEAHGGSVRANAPIEGPGALFELVIPAGATAAETEPA